MSIELKQLDTDEILRYMGCPPDQAGADLRNQAQLCGRHICQTARLRWPGAVTIYSRRRTACVCPAACSSPAGT